MKNIFKKIILIISTTALIFVVLIMAGCDNPDVTGVWGVMRLSDGEVRITRVIDLEAGLDDRGFLVIPAETEVIIETRTRRFGCIGRVNVEQRIEHGIVAEVGDMPSPGVTSGFAFLDSFMRVERIVIPGGILVNSNFWRSLSFTMRDSTNEIIRVHKVNYIEFLEVDESKMGLWSANNGTNIIIPDGTRKLMSEGDIERLNIIEKSEIDTAY